MGLETGTATSRWARATRCTGTSTVTGSERDDGTLVDAGPTKGEPTAESGDEESDEKHVTWYADVEPTGAGARKCETLLEVCTCKFGGDCCSFWRFCYRTVQNGQQATWRSHRRAGTVDEKQPTLHSRRSVILVSNREGELSERVSERVREGWEGRTFTDVYLNKFCVWSTGDAAARSTQHQTSLVASRQRVPARAHVHGLLPCWWELWNMLRCLTSLPLVRRGLSPTPRKYVF